MLDIRLKLHARLIDELDLSKLDKLDEGEHAPPGAAAWSADFARAERMALNTAELDELGASIFDEMVGLGPIEPLLKDDIDQRHPDQRPVPGLRRAARRAGAHPGPLPRQRPPAAHRQPHRRRRRPPDRREPADGRRPPAPTAAG